MQLTGKQIIEKNIITNTCTEGIQQQGVDVRVRRIWKFPPIDSRDGFDLYREGAPISGEIPKEGKTKIPVGIEITLKEGEKWLLAPGFYEVEFMEGCEIPNNCAMYFKSRSSLVRCGGVIESGQFDGGFHTENCGAFMVLHRSIIIEPGARLAQAIVNETYTVSEENEYNGQWQGDKQRKNKLEEFTEAGKPQDLGNIFEGTAEHGRKN